jgi:hypothetical protein
MKNLDDLDPLPKLPRGFRMMHKDNEWYSTPASRRHEAEMAKKRDKLFGEDWQPYKRDGQIVPHTYINGQGKLKTEGYQPPEPPELDVVVMDYDAWCEQILAILRAEQEAKAEPQTQTASQIEQEQAEYQIATGWIPHKPGDPMPCDPEQVVWIKLRDGTPYEGDEAEKAVYWEWDALEEDRGAEIIAWKPAT